jgi:hypothetical protein
LNWSLEAMLDPRDPRGEAEPLNGAIHLSCERGLKPDRGALRALPFVFLMRAALGVTDH